MFCSRLGTFWFTQEVWLSLETLEFRRACLIAVKGCVQGTRSLELLAGVCLDSLTISFLLCFDQKKTKLFINVLIKLMESFGF